MKNKTAGFAKLVDRIEKSNAKFTKATQAQRIVMVSQDILDLLSLDRIHAKNGIYVKLPYADPAPDNKGGPIQLQEYLKQPDLPSCTVCAIGGAMLACTLRLNRVSALPVEMKYQLNYYSGDPSKKNWAESQMSERALEVFPNQLLRYMEDAFESGEFGYGRLTTKGALRAIYQNLVDNKGKKFTWYKNNTKVVYNVIMGLGFYTDRFVY